MVNWHSFSLVVYFFSWIFVMIRAFDILEKMHEKNWLYYVSDILLLYPMPDNTTFSISPPPDHPFRWMIPSSTIGTNRTHGTSTGTNTDLGIDTHPTVEETIITPLQFPELVGPGSPGESDFSVHLYKIRSQPIPKNIAFTIFHSKLKRKL